MIIFCGKKINHATAGIMDSAYFADLVNKFARGRVQSVRALRLTCRAFGAAQYPDVVTTTATDGFTTYARGEYSIMILPSTKGLICGKNNHSRRFKFEYLHDGGTIVFDRNKFAENVARCVIGREQISLFSRHDVRQFKGVTTRGRCICQPITRGYSRLPIKTSILWQAERHARVCTPDKFACESRDIAIDVNDDSIGGVVTVRDGITARKLSPACINVVGAAFIRYGGATFWGPPEWVEKAARVLGVPLYVHVSGL